MSPSPRTASAHSAPRRAEGEVRVLAQVLLRTVLPVGVALGLALAVYGGTGHNLTVVLQDRFPDDSEYSGLFTILFSSALLVSAGLALGAILVARRYAVVRTPATRAGLALALLLVVVGFDDMMMVHDAVLTGAGVPEGVGLAAYGVVGVVLAVVAFRPMRQEGIGLAFVAGLALLAGSLGGDVVEALLADSAPALSRVVGHAEDITKFLAYAALCHVCVLVAFRVFARVVEEAGGAAAVAGSGPRAGRTPAAGLVPRRPVADTELTAPLSLPRAH